MVDVIATLVILSLVFGASYYIYRAKRKGRQCIGCPVSGECQKQRAAKECCHCHSKD
ncbi:MAG: hypothetical protein K6C69_00480 [Lachnospiraceae bacterium]|nr:hypothetical protein [Lachnospiraceae bacterium]